MAEPELDIAARQMAKELLAELGVQAWLRDEYLLKQQFEVKELLKEYQIYYKQAFKIFQKV